MLCSYSFVLYTVLHDMYKAISWNVPIMLIPTYLQNTFWCTHIARELGRGVRHICGCVLSLPVFHYRITNTRGCWNEISRRWAWSNLLWGRWCVWNLGASFQVLILNWKGGFYALAVRSIYHHIVTCFIYWLHDTYKPIQWLTLSATDTSMGTTSGSLSETKVTLRVPAPIRIPADVAKRVISLTVLSSVCICFSPFCSVEKQGIQAKMVSCPLQATSGKTPRTWKKPSRALSAAFDAHGCTILLWPENSSVWQRRHREFCILDLLSTCTYFLVYYSILLITSFRLNLLNLLPHIPRIPRPRNVANCYQT